MTTTYFRNLLAGNIFGTKKSPAIPTAYYYGISSTLPTVAGENVTEPSGGGYARLLLDNMSEPNAGAVTNTTAKSFNESTADWGTFPYFVIFDAATGGNLLIYGQLTNTRTVEKATVLSAKAGEIVLSIQ